MSYDISKVTPRPWAVEEDERYASDNWLIGDDGGRVGKMTFTQDAQHVSHCVNAHDELVEALEWYIGRMDKIHAVMQQSIQPPTIPDKVAMGYLHGLTDTHNVVTHEQKYRALLAKVKP